MKFTQSELELIYQSARPDKDATLTELRAVRRAAKEPLTKTIVENTIDKLLEVPEPECSHFIEDVKACFEGENGQPVLTGWPQPEYKSRPCWGMTCMGWSAACQAHGTWLCWTS